MQARHPLPASLSSEDVSLGSGKRAENEYFFSLVLMFADLRLIGIYELHLFPNCEALAGMINFTASGTC